MNWFKTGTQAIEDTEKEIAQSGGSGGGGGGGGSRGPRRFWMPADTDKRIMFLDDEFFQFWEHNVYLNNSWRHYFVCLLKNGIEQSCYLDKVHRCNLYYIGFLSCVDFSAWTSKKNVTYQYERKLFSCKLGTKDKPGVLRTLKRLKERHGTLTGQIFDVHRKGAKSEGCGDEFTHVETIDPTKLWDYARNQLQIDPEKKEWKPFNYPEIFKPLSNDQLLQIVGSGGDAGEQSNQRGPDQNRSSGGDGGQHQSIGDPAGGDDDVPY